jgi:hypothetical protein
LEHERRERGDTKGNHERHETRRKTRKRGSTKGEDRVRGEGRVGALGVGVVALLTIGAKPHFSLLSPLQILWLSGHS